MSGNKLTKIDGDDLRRSEAGKEWCPIETFDLRFNQLTEISGENFNPLIPYLQGIDLSYNCFSKFPTNPLNIDRLMAFAIRHQRDAQGERCLKEWPEGINAPGSCPNLYLFFQLQLILPIKKLLQRILHFFSGIILKQYRQISCQFIRIMIDFFQLIPILIIIRMSSFHIVDLTLKNSLQSFIVRIGSQNIFI